MFLQFAVIIYFAFLGVYKQYLARLQASFFLDVSRLDRNGLRPARYLITQGGMIVVASEVGVMDFEPGDIKEKGRLQPGKILLIDTEKLEHIVQRGTVAHARLHDGAYLPDVSQGGRGEYTLTGMSDSASLDNVLEFLIM